jgi:MFS family permease
MDLVRDGRAPHTVLLNVGVCLHAINVMMVSTVMPSIVAEIGGATLYAWPSMLYMVGTIAGAACGEPVFAAMGRRGAYILAAVVFGIGAAISGLSPAMSVLIAGQAIQGFGGGLLVALSMALVSAYFEGTLRTRVLSTVSTTWSVAALIGPAIGGVFADFGWWRGAFCVAVIVVALFAWVAWRVLPGGAAARSANVNWPFLRLSILSLGVLCAGLSGQVQSPAVMAALVVAAAVFVWATFRLDTMAESRLFPSRAMSFFSPVGVAYWVSLLLSITHLAVMIFMPLVLQVLHGVSPLWVGYLTIVFSIGWTVGALAVASWQEGRARAAMFWGMVISAASIAALAATVVDGPLWGMAASVTVLGLGIGAANVHIIAWTMAAARPGEESVTASAMQAVRSLGVAFGAAAAGLIANAAGLGDGTVAADVAAAIDWVYSLSIVPPALAALLILRMLSLGTRQSLEAS